MEQTMKFTQANMATDRFLKIKGKIEEMVQWSLNLARGILTALFVPSHVDRQIEESRELARRYLMRTN